MHSGFCVTFSLEYTIGPRLIGAISSPPLLTLYKLYSSHEPDLTVTKLYGSFLHCEVVQGLYVFIWVTFFSLVTSHSEQYRTHMHELHTTSLFHLHLLELIHLCQSFYFCILITCYPTL